MPRRRIVQLIALGLALAGYWLPWLTHPAAALRLNGYELSEWVTFLPAVRDGSLAVGRLVFLLPLGCLALLLSLAAGWQAAPRVQILATTSGAPAFSAHRSGWNALLPAVRGWGSGLLLLLSLVCLFIVFPPYPYLFTAFADAEYRAQMLVASLGLIVLVLALYLPADLKAALQIMLAVLGGGLGLWALLIVRPAASELLGAPWAIGLGWLMTLAGFGVLALGGLRELFGPRVWPAAA